MGWIGKILGSPLGPVTEPVTAVGNVLDQLFTSDEEKLDRAEAMQRLAQQPALAQIEINKIEARHASIFVSGWRPFIGWVCGANLLYLVMIRDWLELAFTVAWPGLDPPPPVGIDLTMELVIALLGLGTLRTAEKLRGRD